MTKQTVGQEHEEVISSISLIHSGQVHRGIVPKPPRGQSAQKSCLTFRKEYGLWQGKFCQEFILLDVLLKNRAVIVNNDSHFWLLVTCRSTVGQQANHAKVLNRPKIDRKQSKNFSS